MSPYDDRDAGPDYDAPDDMDARDEAFHEGAASREPEVAHLVGELQGAEQEIAGLKAEVERLRALLVRCGAMEAA